MTADLPEQPTPAHQRLAETLESREALVNKIKGLESAATRLLDAAKVEDEAAGALARLAAEEESVMAEWAIGCAGNPPPPRAEERQELEARLLGARSTAAAARAAHDAVQGRLAGLHAALGQNSADVETAAAEVVREEALALAEELAALSVAGKRLTIKIAQATQAIFDTGSQREISSPEHGRRLIQVAVTLNGALDRRLQPMGPDEERALQAAEYGNWSARIQSLSQPGGEP